MIGYASSKGVATVPSGDEGEEFPPTALRHEADRSAHADRWNRFVDRSPEGTALHRAEALEAVAEHAGARLHYLVGEVDGDLVGAMPVFERSVGPMTAVFSAPPAWACPP